MFCAIIPPRPRARAVKEFQTFFVTAKVGVERALLWFMYGNYIGRTVSAERFKEFETFFAIAKVGVGRASLSLFSACSLFSFPPF